jgi:flagellar L-ring protein precursor FlgH
MNVYMLTKLRTIDACAAKLDERAGEEEGTNLHLPLLQEQAVRWMRQAKMQDAVDAAPGRIMMSGSTGAKRRSTTSHRATNKRLARSVAGGIAALLILMVASSIGAQSPMGTGAAKSSPSTKPLSTGSNPASSSLEAYLTRVRLENKTVQTSSGAIWSDSGRLTRMSTDVRAMRPHDLISVVVDESLAASTDGSVKNSRASNASSAVTGLMGTLHSGNAMQNLINQNSASGLTAAGASASNSSLTTTLGGQVVEVLPNGMLVIEAARQVEFAQQVQTIILRGLVRPEDISQENKVLSTAISSLEVQVRGKGIINDYTHRQNALARFLQWALVF